MENKKKELDHRTVGLFPKVELHSHLDCNLSFTAVSQLKPGITRETYEREFVSREKFADLADFLKIIDSSLDLMQTERGLHIVTEDLFRQYREDNVIYAEVRFAPLLHLRDGLTPERVVATVESVEPLPTVNQPGQDPCHSCL